MNSPSVSYICKTLLSILFVACLVITPSMVWAQEPTYTEEEYTVFQNIQAEKDEVKKVDMIVKFLQEKPKNALRPYMTPEYQNVIVALAKEKRWNQVIALGDKFLDVAPNDSFTITNLAAGYEATNNTKGFAAFGEKVYALKPSGDLAMALARAYQKLGNDAKYMQWREKVLASDPDNIEILTDMTQKYAASQNNAQALKYARVLLKALPTAKKPADVDEQAWKNTVNGAYATAYGVIGGNAYQQNSFSEAVKNLELAVKYYKRNETAYYWMGMSYWQLRKMDAAMLNFAKAYLIKGTLSKSAKQYLEKIWRESHRNSLAGVERVIERAQQDLK